MLFVSLLKPVGSFASTAVSAFEKLFPIEESVVDRASMPLGLDFAPRDEI